jgi:very-short-patch-repair endonuclease
MAAKKLQPWAGDAWKLTREQHGVVTRGQLLALGMPPRAIRGHLDGGQLHRIWSGVYAVGRPHVGQLGRFKAATLACGSEAQLSHLSAAALWGLRPQPGGPIDVVVPAGSFHRLRGIRLHRRSDLAPPRMVHRIPAGSPLSVLIDLATSLDDEGLEEAVNAADHLKLIATDRLRAALDDSPRLGAGRLRRLLDSQTFSRSQTALERRFLPIALAAGLPRPSAQHRLGRYRVDFHWPELGLVVETDSLTYHRTVAAQTTDMRRDQSHARPGLRTLRFNHAQVFRQPDYVREVLEDTVRHLGPA